MTLPGLAPEAAGTPQPARRRPWVRWAVAVVLVGSVTAWLVVGSHPSLELGGASAAMVPFEAQEDAVGETTWTAEDPGAEGADLELLVRNPAPYPVTVIGIDDVAQRVRLVRSVMPGEADASGRRPVAGQTLRVAAGESFVVRVTVLFPCAPMSPGTSIGYDAADLRVLALGRSGTVSVPYGGRFMVATTEQWLPPAGCTPGEPR